MKNRFIFDLDDTLINTQHRYSLALMKFVNFVYENLGPTAPGITEMLNLQSKIDLEAVTKKNFAMERFPTSLADTFEQLAIKMKKPQGQIVWGKKHSYRLGMEVYDADYWTDELIPGARDTLDFLSNKQDELFLITMGDETVQKRKIEHYDLSQWFGNRTYIVPKEKGPTMKTLSENLDKSKVWYVGNSMRSDIIPALSCGIGAIYIPQSTWAYDNHPNENEEHPRKLTLDSIAEIITLYPSKFSN